MPSRMRRKVGTHRHQREADGTISLWRKSKVCSKAHTESIAASLQAPPPSQSPVHLKQICPDVQSPHKRLSARACSF
eukprot:7501330-Lingulodinium_polyedra.AAC.1